MFDLLKQYPQNIRFYEAHDVPLNRDCFLLNSKDSDLVVKQWKDFFSVSCDYNKWEHPNSLMEYIPCHISQISSTHFNITLLIDRNLRFHTVKKFIPVSQFVSSFVVFSEEKRPYIVVNPSAFEIIKNNIYSTYALVDFIGIRNLITINGEIPVKVINAIKKIVDDFSINNPSLIFLSCADNIIVKSGWSANDVSKYEPEKFVTTIHQLMTQLSEKAGINSYAILTQGVTYVDEKKVELTKSPRNHFFMSSIAVPFIEAFDIDDNVRKQIRNKTFDKAQFYIENSLYTSMRRKFFMQNEPSWFKKFAFTSEKLNTEIKYIPLTFEKIVQLIEMS